MNEHTVTVLDYTRIRDELQSYTVTPMGAEFAAQLWPHTDMALLALQLRETSEMIAILRTGSHFPLAPVADIRPSLAAARVGGAYLEGIQLLQVAVCLEVLQRLRHYAQEQTVPTPLLRQRLLRLPDVGVLLRQLRSALDDKGHLRDHASPTLHQLRHALMQTRDRIHRVLHNLMMTHSRVVQDTVVTIRNDRFVIPLKTDFRQTLRGIVHGESASGATIYVEPDQVVDLNNQLLHIQAEEEREIREILRQLTERLVVQSTVIEQALKSLSEVDLLVAKGRLSLRMAGSAPQLTTQPHLQLREARHPFLADPQPIDVHLQPEQRTLIITGPNTGGKTAVLKTVGLLSLMVQTGLHIPAHPQSVMPIFTDIYADIGDEQNLQQNLSTFSAHLTNIGTMMAHVSSRSLILLDELGAGTDPMEGGPLGAAIVEYFHQSGALTLATTHHSVIKAFAMATPQVACAAVDFDLDTLQPRYRLVYGLPGRSKAFAIAQKLGFPATVITRAQQEAGSTQMRSEQLLAQLERARQAMATERQHLADERLEIERLHAEAQRLRDQAATTEQRIRQECYAEGQQLLKSLRQELDTTLAELRRHTSESTAAVFPRAAWQQAEQALAAWAPELAETAPPPLQVGESVRVRGLHIVGRLRTPITGHGTVQVEVGNKTLMVSASELERLSATDSKVQKHATPTTPRSTTLAASIPTELHLRGATVAEALPLVEKYLDQAFTNGLARVRLIHGIGSGRLREHITAFLGQHPLVRRFQAGDAGGGTTIVELEG